MGGIKILVHIFFFFQVVTGKTMRSAAFISFRTYVKKSYKIFDTNHLP